MKGVAGETSVLESVLKHVRQGGPGVPSVPAAAARIRQMAASDQAGARELGGAVGQDPILAAALLRYANSAMYRGLRPVTDLHTAVSRLGIKMVMAAMMAELSRSLYRFQDAEDSELFMTLWRHAVACGETSRRVAKLVRYPEPEQAFMVGLVHDIGKVASLASLAHLKARGDIQWPREVAMEFIRETHATVGSELLRRWKIPVELCDMVLHHHRELTATSGVALAILQFADLACGKLGYAQEPTPDASLLAENSAHILGLNDLTIASLLVDLEEAIPAVTREI